MILAEKAPAPGEDVRVKFTGTLRVAERTQVNREVGRRDHSVTVVGAQNAPLSDEILLVYPPGDIEPARWPKGSREIPGGQQRVVMVVAQPLAPPLTEVAGEVMAALRVAVAQQVPAGVAGQAPHARVVSSRGVRVKHVVKQLGPPRPANGVFGVAWVVSGQDGLNVGARRSGLRCGQVVAQDGLSKAGGLTHDWRAR